MRQLTVAAGGLGLAGLVGLGGCGFIGDLLLRRTTVVRLVNNSGFGVAVRLYYSDRQETLEAVLTELGTEVNMTIPAGETRSFSRNCDDLQAIVVDDADLLLIGSIGPEATSDVLRDGTDFSCGRTIVFTFDHSAAILDFDVVSSVE